MIFQYSKRRLNHLECGVFFGATPAIGRDPCRFSLGWLDSMWFASYAFNAELSFMIGFQSRMA
jgi:hypothetical protein